MEVIYYYYGARSLNNVLSCNLDDSIIYLTVCFSACDEYPVSARVRSRPQFGVALPTLHAVHLPRRRRLTWPSQACHVALV